MLHNKIIILIFAACISCLLTAVNIFPAKDKTSDAFLKHNKIVLFDPSLNLPVSNNLGKSGIYDLDPDDPQAFCRSTIEKEESPYGEDYHMKLSYKLNPSNPSANGWWIKLNGNDLSSYRAISIKVKGDSNKGFSDSFKIVLKGKTQKIETSVKGVTDKWKTFEIPFFQFNEFMGLDLSKLDELVILFEGSKMRVKEGAYLIDDISFIPKKG